MNFKQLSDEEIFEYLFTSDYSEISNLEDSKYLLDKYKKFIRIMKSKKDKAENENIKLKEFFTKKEVNNNRYIKQLKVEKRNIEDMYNFLLTKRLSLLERLRGKIIN